MSSISARTSDGLPPAERPVRVVLEQGGPLGRWGSRLPWIIALIAVGIAISSYAAFHQYKQRDPELTERFFSHELEATDKVAIITIEGPIMHADGFARWQIERVRRDPDVKAVVVRVDSPGGTVTGSDYLYHHLRKLREDRQLPLVVSMGGVAASGGYYISMAAGDVPDAVFAERTTWTGSIGVIIPHFSIADLLESWKIQDDSLVSGKFKAMGSPTRKLPPELAEEERQLLQTIVNQTFEQFKQIVLESRPQLANNETAFTGQIFTAKQALDLGLVDKLGFIEDAIDRAISMANLDAKKVRVVKYEPRQGLLGSALFGGASAERAGAFNPAALLELTTPRAYFLYTWLPAAIASQSR